MWEKKKKETNCNCPGLLIHRQLENLDPYRDKRRKIPQEILQRIHFQIMPAVKQMDSLFPTTCLG